MILGKDFHFPHPLLKGAIDIALELLLFLVAAACQVVSIVGLLPYSVEDLLLCPRKLRHAAVDAGLGAVIGGVPGAA